MFLRMSLFLPLPPPSISPRALSPQPPLACAPSMHPPLEYYPRSATCSPCPLNPPPPVPLPSRALLPRAGYTPFEERPQVCYASDACLPVCLVAAIYLCMRAHVHMCLHARQEEGREVVMGRSRRGDTDKQGGREAAIASGLETDSTSFSSAPSSSRSRSRSRSPPPSLSPSFLLSLSPLPLPSPSPLPLPPSHRLSVTPALMSRDGNSPSSRIPPPAENAS